MEQILCTNRKIAINRYSHEPYLQNCGKCFPCQLRKRNHYLHHLFTELSKKYKHAYFITLTFDDAHILYVDSILHKNDSTKVYPFSYSLYFSPKDIEKLRYNFSDQFVNHLIKDYTEENKFKFRFNLSQYDFNHLFGHIQGANSISIDSLYNNSKINFDENNNYHYRTAYYPFKGGQLFIKRFRKSFNSYLLAHNKPEEKKIVYFMVQEYGPKTLRPHFHLFMLSNSDYLPNYLAATCKKYSSRENIYTHPAWKFGFVDIQRVNNEEKVSTYIAGYINSFQLLPSTHVQQNLFKTKHSHSLGLGFDFDFYRKSLSWFDENSYLFMSENSNPHSLIAYIYESSMLENSIYTDKSTIQKKYIASTFRLFPKLPFSFLSTSKYRYSIFKEILSSSKSEFTSMLSKNSFTEFHEKYPYIFDLCLSYIKFYREHYFDTVTSVLTSQSFNKWYTNNTGDCDFKFNFKEIHSSFYHSIYNEYLKYQFFSKIASTFCSLHNAFSRITTLYKKSPQWIHIAFNMYVFAHELRDKYLFNQFYPTLNEYMTINHYSFDDIAPIFYPTDYENNQLTHQISKYITSLMPDYTKHRANFEPKY